MVNLETELKRDFKEITPHEFYRAIFREGVLDRWNEKTKGKYTARAIEVTNKEEKNKGIGYCITDDLITLEKLQESKNFCMIAPLAYVGNRSTAKNASVMFAFGIEIDNLIKGDKGEPDGYNAMLSQMRAERLSKDRTILPMPNYIVASGNGLHLYYLFKEPLQLHDSTKKRLKVLKKEFTKKLWNPYITESSNAKQMESAFQKFRLVGGVTKNGDRTKAFETDCKELYTLEKLEYYFDIERLTLADAKKKYPKWHKRRIVEGQPKAQRQGYICERSYYDNWLKRIEKEAVIGCRYHCLWCLVVHAIQCGDKVTYEELREDCMRLQPIYNSMSERKEDAFTIGDVEDALKAFSNKSLKFTSSEEMSEKSGLKIEKKESVKRNGRTMAQHQEYRRLLKELKIKMGEYEEKGRPTKEAMVVKWRKKNPNGNKSQCAKDLQISRTTVTKWWDAPDQ